MITKLLLVGLGIASLVPFRKDILPLQQLRAFYDGTLEEGDAKGFVEPELRDQKFESILNDDSKSPIVGYSSKDGIDSSKSGLTYSSKDGLDYSSKDSKDAMVLDLPNPLDRMIDFPPLPPLPPPINPPPVTEVNPPCQ